MGEKKFFSVIVLTVLLFSSFCFSEDTNTADGVTDDSTNEGLNSEGNSEESLNSGEGSGEDVYDAVAPGNVRSVKDGVVRPVVAKALKNSRQRVAAIKERVANARQVARQKALEFNDTKNRLRAASVQDKNKLREELRVASRETLLKQVETILAKLESIEESEHAPENIEEIIDKFESYKTALENEEISKEELVEISRNIHSFWKRTRVVLLKRISLGINSKMIGLLNKVSVFIERASAMVEKLNERGIDTSDIEEGLDVLEQDADELKALHESIRLRLSEVESREEAAEILRSVHDDLKEMNRRVVVDFQKVKELFREIRALYTQENNSGSETDNADSGVSSEEGDEDAA